MRQLEDLPRLRGVSPGGPILPDSSRLVSGSAARRRALGLGRQADRGSGQDDDPVLVGVHDLARRDGHAADLDWRRPPRRPRSCRSCAGWCPSALMPIARPSIATLSRMQPCTTMPAQPRSTAIAAIRSPTSAERQRTAAVDHEHPARRIGVLGQRLLQQGVVLEALHGHRRAGEPGMPAEAAQLHRDAGQRLTVLVDQIRGRLRCHRSSRHDQLSSWSSGRTESTGHGDSIRIRWALLPSSILPTWLRLRSPITQREALDLGDHARGSPRRGPCHAAPDAR